MKILMGAFIILTFGLIIWAKNVLDTSAEEEKDDRIREMMNKDEEK